MINSLKKNIFTKIGTPKAIISDEGKHFYNNQFTALLSKYGVKNQMALSYHLQMNDQAKISNRNVKRILEKQFKVHVRIGLRSWIIHCGLLDSF